jgi:hypothetical protein
MRSMLKALCATDNGDARRRDELFPPLKNELISTQSSPDVARPSSAGPADDEHRVGNGLGRLTAESVSPDLPKAVQHARKTALIA